jgi:rRNA-processing protein FCF1
MQDVKKELESLAKKLDALVLKIAAKASEFRRYPHYETGDKLDRCAIYVSAARTKCAKARNELC